ncbi:MAG: ferredoxin [Tannerellaceae bacterium]
MAINKVWIEEGCISCGNCEAICPEVFQVNDVSEVQDVDFHAYEDQIKEAAESCPVDVIRYE